MSGSYGHAPRIFAPHPPHSVSRDCEINPIRHIFEGVMQLYQQGDAEASTVCSWDDYIVVLTVTLEVTYHSAHDLYWS